MAVFSISPTTAPNEMSPASFDAGLDDRLDRDQRRSEAALHVVGAESEDPAVAQRRLGPEPVAREMFLVAGIGGVHVAGEQEVEAVAASAQMADRVRPALIDQRQVGLQAGPCASARRDSARRRSRCRSGSRCSRGRSGNRGHLGRDVRGGLREVGMRHVRNPCGAGDRSFILPAPPRSGRSGRCRSRSGSTTAAYAAAAAP